LVGSWPLVIIPIETFAKIDGVGIEHRQGIDALRKRLPRTAPLSSRNNG